MFTSITRTVDIGLATHELLVGAVVVACTHLGLLDRTSIASGVELLGAGNADGALHGNCGHVGEAYSLVKREVRQRNSAVRAWVAVTCKGEYNIASR